MKTIKFFAVLIFMITLNSCEPESLEEYEPYKTEKGKTDTEVQNKKDENFDENIPNLIEEIRTDTGDKYTDTKNQTSDTEDKNNEDEDRGNG